ncbi:MAG: glycosyltransferase [Patescibacteria group bacterium]
MKLSIIIPCYNEAYTLQELIDCVIGVKITPWDKEIIVVDDASTDDTQDILKQYGNRLKVFRLERNSGKGSAVKMGLEQATGDYIIIQDADLEYNPNEFPIFIEALEERKGIVVYGSRNIYHAKRENFYFQRLGVWMITKLINILYGTNLTDVWTCYKFFPQEAKKYFVSGRFEAELLFTAAVLRGGFTICEVPISHTPRDAKHGKKIRYRDGFRAIQLLIADKLINIKKPKIRVVGDYSRIVCCPFCKESFLKIKNVYQCRQHGFFITDESQRPILIEKQVYEKNRTQHESGVNWLKSFLKQFPRLYYSIWHIFCPVMMLVNGPRMILRKVPKGSIIIDIGSGPERLGKEFINVDIFPFPEVDIVSDATQLPFKDNTVDATVSESLFEHVPDAHKVAREMVRIVKPGGYIYVSAPFMHPYHASPDDFNRWTMSGLKYMFRDLKIVESGVRSGPWSTLLMFMAYWLGVIFSFNSRKTAPFLAHVFMLVLGPIKYLDYLFIYIPGSEVVATHLYILGRKKGN